MSVYNKWVAQTFERIAQLLKIRGDDAFKIRAYERAAQTLRRWPEDVRRYWREHRLTELPHIGAALAKKIDELLRTGRLVYLQRLENEVPPGLLDLLDLPGLGPARVRRLWQQAGVTSRDALQNALDQGRLRGIKGLGPAALQRLQQALEQPSSTAAALRLDAAWGLARDLVGHLLEQGAWRAAVMGPPRRWEEVPTEAVVLVATESALQPAWLATWPLAGPWQAVEPNGWRTRTVLGWPITVYWTPPQAWGTMALFTTGPEAHWRALQARAAALGLHLTPHRLHDAAGRPLPGATEEAVYAALRLPWIPPTARVWPLALDRPAAWEEALSTLLPWDQTRQAELHAHTTWSDGKLSVRALAQAALERGLRVLVITDHSGGLRVAGGLSADDLRRQRAEIQAVQADLGSGLLLLQGAEVDILPDGSLDYPEEVLAELDLVIASPHQALGQDSATATQRLLRALAHPRVHILGHPRGRLISRRAGLAPDMARLVRAAAQYGVALEINANPHRLDLDSACARLAHQAGAWLSINTDAHRAADLDFWPYGLAVARRAGLTASSILNLWEPARLQAYLARKRPL